MYTLVASALSLTVLAACQSTQKAPHWVNLPLSEDAAKTWSIQYDQNSVVKNAQNANWRDILILSQPVNADAFPDAKYASMVSNSTIDCQNQAIRFNWMKTYTDRNGTGEIVEDKEISDSEFIPTNKPEDLAVIKTICQ